MTDITRLLASLKRRSAHAKEFGDSITFVKLKDIDALVEALEKTQDSGKVFQQSFFRQSLMYDVVSEAYEEAKEQIAKDVEIKARLCRESNSLFDRLRVAEKRITELESHKAALLKFVRDSCYVFDGCDADISDAYVDAADSELMPKLELESRIVAAESFTCPRCGRTTTHPEGWHYCHKREAE
ncbi:TPA: hypothetical protein L9Q38_000772 [Klebsiella pneumoniae]|nr:hypothetical protein [Klebsiella pneumoniae]HBR4064511.1 hypothetical protein [Klebsiella pneumoniae]